MIALNNLYLSFNQGTTIQVDAVKGIDLDIKAGEFVVITGANGSGKSTLLNLIAGSVLPTSGRIFLDEQDVTRLPEHRRSRWVGRVFQNPLSGTAPDLSILENFRLAALRTKTKGLSIGINSQFKKEVADRLALLQLGLENHTGRLMGSLSGGQRQALTLLMSVMDDCRILLLDEPAAALDPRSALLVMQTADKLIKTHQLTAILVTHNLKDAFSYGTRLLQLSEGRIHRDLNNEQKQGLTPNSLFEWFN